MMAHEAIPFTVIGGYLGAGKTTLLNHILRQSGERRFALLVNDFGSINIDEALIESRTEDTINLANGCICCTLAEGFISAINGLLAREIRPEHIIVEASGVAEPHKIAQYGKLPGLRLDGVVVVVDAETIRRKARDKYVGRTVRAQLSGADLLVVNKIDLVDDETRESVAMWLREQAPDTRQIMGTHAAVPVPLLLGTLHDPSREPSSIDDNQTHEAQYDTWQITHGEPVNRAAFESFVKALPPEVIRAKGVIWLDDAQETRTVYQQVGRRWQLETGALWNDTSPCTQVVVIGLAGTLDKSKLDTAFRVMVCDVFDAL